VNRVFLPQIMHARWKTPLRLFLWLGSALSCASALAFDAVPSPLAASANSGVGVTSSKVKVLGSIPHAKSAFTEGLTFWNGRLFESTGMYGESTLREVDLGTGKTLHEVKLAAKYFGEGMTVLKGKLYQLTWREQVCFVYDPATLKKIGEIAYDGEGWGLTEDGSSLIMSDGSEWIRYRDPETLQVKRAVQVTLQGKPVSNINELEFIDGKIWANVWGSDFILGIDPADGHVTDVLDASGLLPANQRSADGNDVLNGIAYNPKTHNVYITGKRWPLLFGIRLPH
jgi:glutaminyl-peptide cyclotransferase